MKKKAGKKKHICKNEKYQSFHDYYQKIYGSRWEILQNALLETHEKSNYNHNLLTSYYMDEASVICAKQIQPQAGDDILDMCAAPGGKSLVIASLLANHGKLTLNDRSANRRARLKQVLRDHLEPTWLQNIEVTGHDATKWGLYEQNKYDKVLLDAPCSSEQHVLHNEKYLLEWSPSRTKRLAQQQYAMILAAFDVVKPDGIIIYSTCSISPLENDGVVEKLLKKHKKAIIEPIEHDVGETTVYGRLFLPDISDGAGPMYISKIRKIEL